MRRAKWVDVVRVDVTVTAGARGETTEFASIYFEVGAGHLCYWTRLVLLDETDKTCLSVIFMNGVSRACCLAPNMLLTAGVLPGDILVRIPPGSPGSV